MNYILWITLDKDTQAKIGSLGRINFKRGAYLYVGSAKKNFQARIGRHLVKKKRIFWHIDYLLSLNGTKIKQIWMTNKDKDCKIARFLYRKDYSFINRFGSSDCDCRSHLFFINKSTGRAQGLLKKRGFVKYADKNYCSWLN